MTLSEFLSNLTKTLVVIIIICVAFGIFTDNMEVLQIGSVFSWSYFGFTLLHLVIFLRSKKKQAKHDS